MAPQIATNTGNIIRLCANVGASLHLVAPLGFRMDSTLLKRAGLDYHELTSVAVHAELGDLVRRLPGPRFTFRSQATTLHTEVAYPSDAALIFGAESSGLSPDELEALDPATALRIPMRPANRSLNLANAVAIATYEAWRQHDFTGQAPGPQPGHGVTSETLLSEPFDR